MAVVPELWTVFLSVSVMTTAVCRVYGVWVQAGQCAVKTRNLSLSWFSRHRVHDGLMKVPVQMREASGRILLVS